MMKYSRWMLSAALVVVAGACGGAPPGSTDGEASDASDAAVNPRDVNTSGPALSHQSAPIDVAPGQEITEQCESWTLGNTTTLYVNTVEFDSGGGLHHSNWVWVPERLYQGPDGTWPCASRGFEQVAATASGGGVLFAQTTQSVREAQRFPAGVVVPIPPRARVIGSLHVLNASPSALRTHVAMNLVTLPADQVRVRLAGLAMQYLPLSLPPRTRSEFTTRCDLDAPHRRIFGRPLDFRIYYALPHYHALGRSLRLRAVGGPRDGQVVFETRAGLGEPAGRTLDPPFEMAGAQGLEFSCTFDNPRATTVGWGVGDQEMCVLLAFVDSTHQWAAGALMEGTNTVLGERDGVSYNSSGCSAGAIPSPGATQP